MKHAFSILFLVLVFLAARVQGAGLTVSSTNGYSTNQTLVNPKLFGMNTNYGGGGVVTGNLNPGLTVSGDANTSTLQIQTTNVAQWCLLTEIAPQGALPIPGNGSGFIIFPADPNGGSTENGWVYVVGNLYAQDSFRSDFGAITTDGSGNLTVGGSLRVGTIIGHPTYSVSISGGYAGSSLFPGATLDVFGPNTVASSTLTTGAGSLWIPAGGPGSTRTITNIALSVTGSTGALPATTNLTIFICTNGPGNLVAGIAVAGVGGTFNCDGSTMVTNFVDNIRINSTNLWLVGLSNGSPATVNFKVNWIIQMD